MSSNDLFLLNQLLEQHFSEIGQGLTDMEYFEIFCAEQVLKDDDLSYEELTAGIVDGGGDGGIDALYFFVNDALFYEEMEKISQKKKVPLRLVLIQSKISPTFDESAIDKMISSARDLFNLSQDLKNLASVYNQSLLDKILCFRNTFVNLTSKFPEVTLNYVYATKGSEVHPNVKRKVSGLEEVIKSFFNPVSFDFKFLKAADLLASARKSPSTITSLRLAENPISTGQEGFVCLVTLTEYLAFISDTKGHLRSNLFEGNVRDYQGKNEVNTEIRKTLETPASEDFWWLNNGVSIICSNATLSGKTLTIADAEIVNGLQSSREIYHALQEKDLSKESRYLLVRVLKPQDQESRDRIIKATNSQTPIPASSLRATDKIHRDIEEYLSGKGYFYDRRKNYYKNAGKPIKKIFGIPFVAQSVLACALKEPANARARPSSLIKRDDEYKRIFNSEYPLEIYLKCPLIVQTVSDIVKRSGTDDHRKHLNNIIFYVATLWALRQSGLPNPTVNQIAQLDILELTPETIRPIVAEVWDEYVELGQNDQVAKGVELSKVLLEKHRKQAIETIKSAGLPTGDSSGPATQS